MERWVNRNGRLGEVPEIDKFLEEIVEVCIRHRLSLAHEDFHGAFLVEEMDLKNIIWLSDAQDNRRY